MFSGPFIALVESDISRLRRYDSLPMRKSKTFTISTLRTIRTYVYSVCF
jgi:hypothetical protein